MQVADITLFGDTFKLFDTIYPVGYVYPQYPGQKDPNEMWGDFSTWEQLDYGGAFFRAANGNSEEFEKTLTITDLNGTNITFEEEHGLLKGSILYDPDGNESRLVDEITDEHTVVIDRVFSSITLTKVYITQNQSLPNITGNIDGIGQDVCYAAADGAFYVNGNVGTLADNGDAYQPRRVTLDASRISDTYQDDANVTVINYSMKLWKRIN